MRRRVQNLTGIPTLQKVMGIDPFYIKKRSKKIMVNEKYWNTATLIRACENPEKFYLCMFGRRYIFEDGKYVGWYKA